MLQCSMIRRGRPQSHGALSQAIEHMSVELASLARGPVEAVIRQFVEDVVAPQYNFTKGCMERLIVDGARFSELGSRRRSTR